LAILAILFQLGFQFGSGLSAPAMAASSDGDTPPMIICSAAGGIVKIQGGADQENPGNTEMPCVFCLLCQARILGVNLLPIAQIDLAPSSESKQVYDRSSLAELISLGLPSQRYPRAPPTFVS